MAAPQVNTYHCLCTSLLLATTHTLSSLPRRSSDDAALILPIPPLPSTSRSTPQAEGEIELDKEAQEAVSSLPVTGYTTVLSISTDRTPTLIRRSDGFESRKLLRCGRCRLVVGYELDRSGHIGKANFHDSENGRIVYLLPGGIMSTEVMVAGKKIAEEDVELKGMAVFT